MKNIATLCLACSFAFGADTDALRIERARFAREAITAIEPVKQAYTQRLTALLLELTKAGKLEAALEVKSELQKANGIKPGNFNAPIAGQTWGWQIGAVQFGTDGLVHTLDGNWESRGLVTSWEHLGNGVVLLKIEKGRNNQLIALLRFNPLWSSYTGWAFDGTTIKEQKRVN